MKNIIDYIYESQINEMSISLSDYSFKVENRIVQIIENWCLVKLCDLYSKESFSINRNHWCSELKSYITYIRKLKIKHGNKDKIIKKLFIKEMDLDIPSEVCDIIRDKLKKEDLLKYINIISIECSNNINQICELLYNENIDIDDYLNGEIG